MEALTQAIEESAKSSQARQDCLAELEQFLEHRASQPALVYKLFRNLCVEGKCAQDKIFELISPISPQPYKEYYELLHNLSVRNVLVAQHLSNLLEQFEFTPFTMKYIIMIAYQVLLQTDFSAFIAKHPQLVNGFAKLLQAADDSCLEWLYYFFKRLTQESPKQVLEVLDDQSAKEYLEFLASALEDSYEARQPIVDRADAWLSLSGFYELCSAFVENPELRRLVCIINVCLRDPSADLQGAFWDSGVAKVFWSQVSSSQAVLVLQTLANSVKHYPPGASSAIDPLLNAVWNKELDLREPLCKEWTLILIHWIGEERPDVGQRLKDTIAALQTSN